MELRQLRYFMALTEQMHFTRAAEKLNIVQSALSKQIRLLEEELGVQLLERTAACTSDTRRAYLPPKAEVILNRRRQPRWLPGRQLLGESQLRMGSYSTIAWAILPQLLKSFYTAQPAVSIQLLWFEASQQITALKDEKIDIGFSSIISNDGQLEFKLLTSKAQIVAMPENHPAARHEKVDLRWFSEDRFIIPPSKNPYGTHEQILEACLDAGFMPKKEQTIPAAEAAVGLVASGLGIAIVPEWHQNRQVSGVTFRHLTKPLLKVNYFTVRRKGDSSSSLQCMWNTIDTLQNI